jgi:hypothetical protein
MRLILFVSSGKISLPFAGRTFVAALNRKAVNVTVIRHDLFFC